jgi:serine/threonine protein kinase/tetratricopeptide (TPR) repeat protein
MIQKEQIEIGSRIAGRYEVIARIGEGTSSCVFRVRDLTSKTDLALKLILNSCPGINFIQHEFKFLSSLNHPNLVPVYNFGKEGQRYFYTMELIEGPGLLSRQFAWNEIIDITAQLCLALEHIHQQDIIHLDIKPGNILLSDNSHVKLADFGFAQCYTAGQSLVRSLGTPAYVSPEVLSGQAPDNRSDLFSLGVVMYQLAVRQLPFEAPSFEQLVDKILHRPPLPPSRIKSEVPEALEGLIMKLLSKSPAERPSSANEVIEELNYGLKLKLPLAARSGQRDHVFFPRLIGRDRELRELRQALKSAEGSQGNCIFISGETGIGRSRLLSEFANQAQLAGINVFWSRCYQENLAAFQPIEQLLSQLAPLAQSFRPEILETYGPAISPVSPALDEFLDGISKPGSSGLPEPGQKLRILDSIARLTIETISALPQVASLIIFEGLHRADPETIDVITHLCRNISKEPILVLGSFRSDIPDENRSLGRAIELLAAENKAEQMFLKRLNQEDTFRLICSLFPQARNLETLSQRIFEAAGGNPFLIEETVHYLMSSGHIRRESGRWHIDPLFRDSMELPKNIREIWQQKIAALPEVQTRILQAMSVFARPASDDDVALALDLPAEQLSQHLIHLKGRDIITPVRDEDRTLFGFHHSKLEQFIYQSIDPAAAETLHRKIAQMLETRKDRSAQDNISLARHWEKAGEPERSGQYHLLAARHLQSYSSQQALDHYLSALQAARPEDRKILLPEIARLYYRSGHHQRCLEACRELIGLGDDGPEIRRLSGGCCQALGDCEEALAEFSLGLKLSGGQPRLAAGIQASMADAYIALGEFGRAEKICLEGLKKLPPEGDPLAESELYNGLGQIYWHLADWAQAITAHQKSLGLKEQAGDKFGIAASYNNLGAVYYRMYEWDRAADCHRKSFLLRQEIGDLGGLAKSYNNLALIYRHLYDWDEAMVFHAKCLEILERIGSSYEMAVSHINLGFIHKARGEMDQALWNYNQGIQIALKIDAKILLLDAFIKKSELYLSLGSLKDASLFCQKALEISEILGGKLETGRGLNIQGRIYQVKRQWDKARETLGRALEIFTELDIKAGEAFILKNLADLHLETGQAEKSGQLADKALRLAQRVEEQHLVSEILLLKGQLREEMGQAGIREMEWALEISDRVRIQETSGFIYGAMARHYLRRKDHSTASQYYQKAVAAFKQTSQHISQPELKNSFLQEPRRKQILREIQQLYLEVSGHGPAS